ncbi:MAG: preprotein translocase subunit SecY [Candidatus Electryonea clarkiae]|nr:preprotein translocase subunit SecY [Candidatus Electryonea clarkiae]MDP8288607.1 preprotein translocase subunit SecY [Candidatus Electryonea clarkiae]
MLEKLQNIFKIPELRKRIIFTLSIFIIYRIGGHIPVPGIDAGVLGTFFEQQANTLFGLYDLFAGGNLSRATIFALGIMPYISASIIIQLLATVVPYFHRLQQQGDEGRKKITQLTRYGTVGISIMQAVGVSAFLAGIQIGTQKVVIAPGIPFYLLTMITLTAGTIFIMWLGEQIDERGIGNGISLIIFVGIIDRFPYAFLDEYQLLRQGIRSIMMELVLLAVMVLTVMAVVLLTQGQRRITVQYTKRVVGRKMYGGQSTHIPLRINTAGVMPIIFAQTIMFFPQTVSTFLPAGGLQDWLSTAFRMDSWIYIIFYSLLIIFFTYFYTAIAFNPVDVATNLKKYGGMIPGVKPGKKTAEFLDNILTRITLPGSVALAFIAVFPTLISKYTNVGYNLSSFYGGTSLLIVVGVALDTLQQVDSHLLMRHYDGLMKSGRLRGRRRM